MAKSAASVGQMWLTGMQNAGPKIKAGVDAMTVNPMEEAAKQKDRYADGVRRAAQDGTWEAGLRRVDVTTWKNKLKGTGIDRISGGAKDALPAVVKFLGDLLPVSEQIKQEVKGMEKGSTEAGLARVRVAIERMKELAARRRGL